MGDVTRASRPLRREFQRTNSNGFYTFTGLRAGAYAIQETQSAAHFDGIDAIGTQGGSTSNDLFFNIHLNSGIKGNNNNFGDESIFNGCP